MEVFEGTNKPLKKNKFAETCVDLECVIHSEICQKEENKYFMLMHIWRIYKNDTDEPICKAEIETDTENKAMDAKQGKEGSRRN